MIVRHITLLVASAALLIAAAGCSGKTNNTVSGTVTFDGQPVANGLIRFLPADASQKRVEAIITAGKYAAAAPLGENRIEISAVKVTGKKKMYEAPDSPVVDVVGELLPARYNVKSELTMTVAAGEQTKDFPLTSK